MRSDTPVHLQMGVVKMETLRGDIFDLLSFDADFCGENGDDYLSEEAKEAGYEDNLTYWIDQEIEDATNKGDVPAIINAVLENYKSCWKFEFNSIQHCDDIWFCAVATQLNC